MPVELPCVVPELKRGLLDVGDRAGRPRGREIALQPRELSGSGGDVHPTVQGNDVPRAEVVAVVALPGLACGAPEVGEVGSGAGRVVVVNAGCGTRARLVTAPGRVVAVREVAHRPVGIGVVPGRENRAVDAVEQGRSGLVS